MNLRSIFFYTVAALAVTITSADAYSFHAFNPSATTTGIGARQV